MDDFIDQVTGCASQSERAELFRRADPGTLERFVTALSQTWDENIEIRDSAVEELFLVASALARAGRPSFGMPLALRAVGHARERQDVHGLGLALGTLSILQKDAGMLQEARESSLEVLAVWLTVDDAWGIVKALVNLGIAHSELKQYELALALFSRALEYARLSEDAELAQLVRSNIAISAHRVLLDMLLEGRPIREWLESLTDLHALDAFVAGISDGIDLLLTHAQCPPFGALVNLVSAVAAEICREEEFELACSVLEVLHRLALSIEARPEAAQALLNLVGASSRTDNFLRTLDTAERCLSEAKANRLPFVEAACHLNRGSAYEVQKLFQEAMNDYHRAANLAVSSGYEELAALARAGAERTGRAIGDAKVRSQDRERSDRGPVPAGSRTCPICRGTGSLVVRRHGEVTCIRCSGSGTVSGAEAGGPVPALLAFVDRDYSTCFDRAMQGNLDNPSHLLVQLQMISLQRLAEDVAVRGPADRIAAKYSHVFRRFLWEKTLVELTAGDIPLFEALQRAETDAQRSQAKYYAAARKLTKGDRAGAKVLLEECLPALDFPEALMAQADLADAAGRLNQPASSSSARPDNWRDFANAANNEGVAHREAGEFLEAEAAFGRALRLYEENVEKAGIEYAGILSNLGGLCEHVGDWNAAENYYGRAIAAIHEGRVPTPVEGVIRMNLAGLAMAVRDYVRAGAEYETAISILRNFKGAHDATLATALSNRAELVRREGNAAKAGILYLEALSCAQGAPVKRPRFAAHALNGLALTFWAQGNRQAAMLLLRHVVTVLEAEGAEDVANYTTALLNLAASLMAEGEHSSARALAERCMDKEWEMILNLLSGGSQDRQQSLVELLTGHYYQYLSHAVLGDLSGPEAAAALDVVLNRKGILLEAQLAERRGRNSHFCGRGSFEASVADLSSHLPREAALVEYVRFHPLDATKIDEGDVEGWAPARYLAFVLCGPSTRDVHVADLGEAEVLEHLVSAFCTARGSSTASGVLDPQQRARDQALDPASAVADGEALRAAVLDPVLRLVGDTRRLILAPDGELSKLPFEALPLDRGQRVIDRYRISYLAAARDLLRAVIRRSGAPSPALVIADPDYDLRVPEDAPRSDAAPAGARVGGACSSGESLHFTRLEGTRAEGERVAIMLETEAHLDSDAVERLLKDAQSPRILHLATHGFFLEDVDEGAYLRASPGMPITTMPRSEAARVAGEGPVIRSGLAMAGANSCLRGDPVPPEAEDGLLSADDAADLSLDATDLVVLSACDTGLGDIRIGQGVLGLRSAFILAGARSLVMSLWRVPDQETKRLMINFYRAVLRGLPVAEALREAQLALKVDRPEPVYWAGFICQGDPGDLTSAEPRAEDTVERSRG